MHYSETYRRYPKLVAGVHFTPNYAPTESRQIAEGVTVDFICVGDEYHVRTHGMPHPLTGEVGVFIEDGGPREETARVVFEATCERITNKVA